MYEEKRVTGMNSEGREQKGENACNEEEKLTSELMDILTDFFPRAKRESRRFVKPPRRPQAKRLR